MSESNPLSKIEQARESESVHETHLKEGIPQIMGCTGTEEDFGDTLPYKITAALHDVEQQNVSNINYFDTKENLDKKGFKYQEERSYVISKIDSTDKFSSKFSRCIGLVVAGRDKDTGEEVSFAVHVPGLISEEMAENKFKYYLGNFDKAFEDDLVDSLKEMKSRCEPGTIDAISMGGTISEDNDMTNEMYQHTTATLDRLVKQELDFNLPTSLAPKQEENKEIRNDAMYYENESRKLYIIKS